MRNVVKYRDDLPENVITARRDAMDRAIPQALVTGYADIVDGLKLPDAGDRHVLAAAIVGRADVIVTYNLKHFPADQLAPYGIEAQYPDEFLNYQRTLAETAFLECVKQIRARLSKSKYSAETYIDNLRNCQLQVVADGLLKAKSLI